MQVNTLYNENCLDTMKRMDSDSIDLVVTSPPYDNLRSYHGYSFPFEDIAKELYRVVKPGGVVVWVVSDATINGSETGTSFRQALYFKDVCGFNLHDTMIYQVPGAGAKGSKYSYWQVFEYMFIFSKGTPKTVNRIKDKPNKRAGTFCSSGYKQKSVGTRLHSSKGTIIADIGYRDNVWVIHPGNNGGYQTSHPAPFPEALARDHILSWSNEGNIVYDPFMGSGTTAKAAIKLNRKWIGSEISEDYCKIIMERLRWNSDEPCFDEESDGKAFKMKDDSCAFFDMFGA